MKRFFALLGIGVGCVLGYAALAARRKSPHPAVR